MNDLHAWLSQQHHGLRTFRIFQQKLETLGRDDPAQRGLCRLLSSLVGSYVEAFDEAPLPVEIADSTYQRLLTLVASPTPRRRRAAARRYQSGRDLRAVALTSQDRRGGSRHAPVGRDHRVVLVRTRHYVTNGERSRPVSASWCA